MEDLGLAIHQSLDRYFWKQAGFAQPPDLQGPRRYLKSLTKRGKHELRGVAMAVFTGSHWPRDRVGEHTKAEESYRCCQRCKNGSAETAFHRFWECPANNHLPEQLWVSGLTCASRCGGSFLPAGQRWTRLLRRPG